MESKKFAEEISQILAQTVNSDKVPDSKSDNTEIIIESATITIEDVSDIMIIFESRYNWYEDLFVLDGRKLVHTSRYNNTSFMLNEPT